MGRQRWTDRNLDTSQAPSLLTQSTLSTPVCPSIPCSPYQSIVLWLIAQSVDANYILALFIAQVIMGFCHGFTPLNKLRFRNNVCFFAQVSACSSI